MDVHGNLVQNNYSILNCLLNNTNISGSFTFDSDLLDGIISEANEQLPDHTVNPDYYIDGTNLIITAGKDGVNVDSTT